MTLPPANNDELVSAYLDGEATPDEIAQVEARPELLAQVEALRAVSERLSVIPAAPAEQKETHIAAALNVFDDLRIPGASTPSSAEAVQRQGGNQPRAAVTSLAQARENRRPRRVNALAVAAAAIAVVFIGVTAISLSTSSNSSDLAGDAALDKTEATIADSAAAAEDAVDVADAGDSISASESVDSAQEAPLAPAESAASSERSSDGADEAFVQEPADDPAAGAEIADAELGEADLDDAQSAPAPADTEPPEAIAEESVDGELRIPIEVETSALYLGFVSDQNDLAAQLRERLFVEPEVFDFETCQGSVAELEESEEPTLIAVAILDDRVVEIHQIPDATTQVIIEQQTCELVDELTP